jgi:hypothetical protein
MHGYPVSEKKTERKKKDSLQTGVTFVAVDFDKFLRLLAVF